MQVETGVNSKLFDVISRIITVFIKNNWTYRKVIKVEEAIFWVLVLCSLVDVYCPDDGGSKHHWNSGKLLSD
jgi:hypothetical protein